MLPLLYPAIYLESYSRNQVNRAVYRPSALSPSRQWARGPRPENLVTVGGFRQVSCDVLGPYRQEYGVAREG